MLIKIEVIQYERCPIEGIEGVHRVSRVPTPGEIVTKFGRAFVVENVYHELDWVEGWPAAFLRVREA